MYKVTKTHKMGTELGETGKLFCDLTQVWQRWGHTGCFNLLLIFTDLYEEVNVSKGSGKSQKGRCCRRSPIILDPQPSSCITHGPCSHPTQQPAQSNAKCSEILQCPGSRCQFSPTNCSFCMEGETLFPQPAWGRGTGGTELQV